MTPQVWTAAKSLYFEAAAAVAGPEAFLCGLKNVDQEVLDLVWQLLSQEPELLPDLHHPCWLADGGASPVRALEPGSRLLDRFEIIDFLGAGGLGEVYRAFDHRQRVVVALKTPRTELAADATVVSMFRNELNTARSVSSPSVCRLHDIHWSRNPGTPLFFTMDLLDGETLTLYIGRNGPFTIVSAKPLVQQMIDGLAAAHAGNIIHRDFKSGNVMLVENGTRAVIMDFGLAREILPGVSLDSTFSGNSFAGTIAYMAPELLRGGKATFASDIYGFGVVLFEMTTGHLPFEGTTPLDVASRRLSEAAPSPRRFSPKLNEIWERTILRCLEADPERRPASMEAIRNMLDAEAPVFWRRRRFLLATAASVSAASGAALWSLTKHRAPVGVELFDIENRTGDPHYDYIARGTTGELLRRLASGRELAVIPMHTVRTRPTAAGAGQFALSGSLNSDAGNSLYLEVFLNETSRSRPVWSGAFHKDQFGGLLAMQEEVSKEAAVQLRRQVADTQGVALAGLVDWLPSVSGGGPPTRNSTAFDLYLRANNLLQEATPESLDAAKHLFERAIAEDPRFALAIAALAETYLALMNVAHESYAAITAAARDNAIRAVREDPSLAEAHAVMGAVNQLDWDWLGSESEYDRALQLKPQFSRAIRWRAGLILQFERFGEAIAGFEEAFRQDPYDHSAISGYGLALIYAGKLREAVAMLTREIGDRDLPAPRNNLALALAFLARRAPAAEADNLYQKAFEQVQLIAAIERRSPSGHAERSDVLYALIHSMRREFDKAAPHLEKLERDVAAGQYNPGILAEIYVAQSRFDLALNALDQALALRDRSLMYLRVSTFFEELRGQPRFEAMLRTMHLK